MSRTFVVPVVGMHFRPPAKGIISVLPMGQALRLVAEPDNEYDPNAIKVLVGVDAIPPEAHEALGEAVAAYGFSLEDILGKAEWQLGYVARDYAAALVRPLADASGYTATLQINGAGKYSARVTLT